MTNLTNAQQPAYGLTTSHPSHMAPKAHAAHRAGGMARTHSRGSSGGGSRPGLSQLQLTQKDSAPVKHTDRARKSHLLHEGNKSATHLARNNSNVRVPSREHVNPSTLRRAPPPLSKASKQKGGFTISSPSEGEDDDWISSESGAATPSHESDVEETAATPVDKRKPHFILPSAQTNGFAKDDHPTPRAEAPALPRVETFRPSQGPVGGPLPTSRDYAPQLQPPLPAQTAQIQTSSQLASGPLDRRQSRAQAETQPLSQSPPTLPPVTKALSETHSPPRRSPDAPKRQSMTRPPSTNSVTGSSVHLLRPHPLIRAHSAGHGALLRPAKPVPLAPLTTVSTEPVPGQMTSSTSPTSFRAISPTLVMSTSGVSPVLSQPSPSGSEASKQLRRTSISSRSSAATLPAFPVQASASHAQLGKAVSHDRQRTLSSSSTFGGALSNLSNLNLQMRSTPSPPKTPIQHVTVYFPPGEQVSQSESVHTLLPPPYLSAHLTMLQYRNPLAESYSRVMCAKQGR